MKRLKLIVAGLVMALACAAQPATTTNIWVPQSAPLTTVTTTGAVGTTTYCYWLVTNYSILGATVKSAPSGYICIATANATLSAANFDTVNWLAPTTPLYAVASYDLLRTTNATPPTGACNCAVATAISNAVVTQTDQANALNSYTVATQTYTSTVNYPLLSGGLPVVLFCGATSGNANCGNTNPQYTAKVYGGAATLAANSAVITFNATNGGFTSTATYSCVANDVTTRANPVQMVQTSTTTATITNTTGASDVIQWICMGY